MRWLSALPLLAIALVASATAEGPPDRLERFKELSRQYVESSDPASDNALLASLFEIADAEVVDSLRGGGPFASIGFIRERLDAFGDEWGGASLTVAETGSTAKGATMLGL